MSKTEPSMEADGDFSDWQDVTGYEDDIWDVPLQDIDIIEYRVNEEIDQLFFYLKVNGRMLEGDEQGHVETVCIFIDLDIDSETGYLTKGIGADYMIKIYGREGKVISSHLFEFNSQNQHSWNRFMGRSFVKTAVFESELEAAVSRSVIGLKNSQRIEVLFYIQDYQGNEDFSDNVATNIGGVLSVNQRSTSFNDIVSPSPSQHVLELNFHALDEPIIVKSITITKPTNAASVQLKMQGHFSATTNFEGDIATFQIEGTLEEFATVIIYANTQSLNGKAVGFRIAKKDDVVVDSAVVFLSTGKIRSMYVNSPRGISVDGAFGDWDKSHFLQDSINDVNNANIDIWNYHASQDNESNKLFFYFNVNGEMLQGKSVAFINSGTFLEPAPTDGLDRDRDQDTVPDSLDPFPRDFNNNGVDDANENGDVDGDGVRDYPGGNDLWLNTSLPQNFPADFRGREVSLYIGPIPKAADLTGLDMVHVYIDSDNNLSTGYRHISMGLGADYLIEITGKEGIIVEREFMKFDALKQTSWEWTELILDIEAEIDFTQMEIATDMDIMGIEANFSYLIRTSDWSKSERDYSSERATRYSRDGRGSDKSSPASLPRGSRAWPSSGDWIEVMTDSDDDVSDASLEILKVSYYGDGTYYYFKIDLEGAPGALTTNTWGIYIDTDGDNNNDYAIMEDDADKVDYYSWGGTTWDYADTSGTGGGTDNVQTGSNYIAFRVDPSKAGSFGGTAKITAFAEDDGSYDMEGNTNQNPRNGQEGDHEDASDISTIPEFQDILIPTFSIMGLFLIYSRKSRKKKNNK
jgi:hypothetical protein